MSDYKIAINLYAIELGGGIPDELADVYEAYVNSSGNMVDKSLLQVLEYRGDDWLQEFGLQLVTNPTKTYTTAIHNASGYYQVVREVDLEEYSSNSGSTTYTITIYDVASSSEIGNADYDLDSFSWGLSSNPYTVSSGKSIGTQLTASGYNDKFRIVQNMNTSITCLINGEETNKVSGVDSPVAIEWDDITSNVTAIAQAYHQWTYNYFTLTWENGTIEVPSVDLDSDCCNIEVVVKIVFTYRDGTTYTDYVTWNTWETDGSNYQGLLSGDDGSTTSGTSGSITIPDTWDSDGTMSVSMSYVFYDGAGNEIEYDTTDSSYSIYVYGTVTYSSGETATNTMSAIWAGFGASVVESLSYSLSYGDKSDYITGLTLKFTCGH